MLDALAKIYDGGGSLIGVGYALFEGDPRFVTAVGLRFESVSAVFRAVAEREGPSDKVLIVGAGALARFTSEDLEKRGRHQIVGFLDFPGEGCSSSLKSMIVPLTFWKRSERKSETREIFPMRRGMRCPQQSQGS